MAAPAYWDISPTLRPGMPTWPGDTPFECRRTWHLDETCPVNVSAITLSTHAGSHADAPFHYDPTGARADHLDLSLYMGPCRVVDATGAGARVEPQDLEPHLSPQVPRVLIRTYAKAPLEAWDSSFKALAPAAIHLLADRGVVLVGVDTPSLDPETSKTMDAHHALHRRGLAVLEGLVLDGVAPGEYELIALPLKLAGLDAAPVRAILRPLRP